MVDAILLETISRVLKVDSTIIDLNTKAKDVDQWDSLGHLYLILELEKTYKVKFKTNEIPTLTSVESLQTALKKYGAI